MEKTVFAYSKSLFFLQNILKSTDYTNYYTIIVKNST